MNHEFVEGEKVAATYQKCGLEQYDTNPLISALPKILGEAEAAKALVRRVGYNPKHRRLSNELRQHSLLPMLQFFQPLSHHIDLEGKISRMIRFGYASRNPLKQTFYRDMREKADNLQTRNIPATVTSSTILGTSGTGKTTAVNRILDLYPQVIQHTKFQGKALNHQQIAWMKLECPFDGSVKGICRQFFEKIDKILGTDYRMMMNRNPTVDALLPQIAMLAGVHTLGMLVIDEIQHLSTSKSGGSGRMLNFFVELTNTMNVPILLIGTTKAISVISQEFRSARRGSGQGETVWRPMKKDDEWELFLDTLWEYQVTQKESPLTPELSDALFYESQGITDFAVKLYMLSQIRAISTGVERVTSTIISSVAKDSLQTAQPYLQALRTGDFKSLPNFEDIIQPLDYEKLAEQEARANKVKFVTVVAPPTPRQKITKRTKMVPSGGLIELLQTKGAQTAHDAFNLAGFITTPAFQKTA